RICASFFQQPLGNEWTAAAAGTNDSGWRPALLQDLDGRKPDLRIVVVRERVVEEQHRVTRAVRWRKIRECPPPPLRQGTPRIHPQDPFRHPRRPVRNRRERTCKGRYSRDSTQRQGTQRRPVAFVVARQKLALVPSHIHVHRTLCLT